MSHELGGRGLSCVSGDSLLIEITINEQETGCGRQCLFAESDSRRGEIEQRKSVTCQEFLKPPSGKLYMVFALEQTTVPFVWEPVE